ncbi:unnamed protein product [Parnassius mnemosyne]|uniref:Uncharacterized protein n=1 Tax=Parnassius mnemosyne TaxID=213953 RepID=A0AAV1MBK6_9NEOP
MSLQYVKIYYGPYDAFHTVSHKPQKLRGLKDRLQKLGYRIDLVPVEYINYCMLEMCGHEVFRCNIQNLQFNTPVDSDPVGERAVQAVVDASAKFLRARSYLWFWALIENQLFRRSEYAPKDHWPFDVDLESFETCLQCPACASLKNQN